MTDKQGQYDWRAEKNLDGSKSADTYLVRWSILSVCRQAHCVLFNPYMHTVAPCIGGEGGLESSLFFYKTLVCRFLSAIAERKIDLSKKNSEIGNTLSKDRGEEKRVDRNYYQYFPVGMNF